MKKIVFDDALFIQKYEELKSSRKMAEYYNCSKGTILKHAKEIGYDISNNKEVKITNVPINDVIALYEELGSCQAVGDYYNCSTTAVRNYFKQNNYQPINKNIKLANISKEDFINKYEELKSAEKMGQYYNCSATAILNYCQKINYDPNTNKKYKLSEQDKQDIINQYNKKTSTELAEKYNCSRGMITKIWYDNDLLNKELPDVKTTEIDITNQTFGYWTVMYKTDKRSSSGNIYWHCRCKCGNERDVTGNTLRNGASQSCGCLQSKGNKKISQILIEANIPYKQEAKFDDCKDINVLPFDFYVDNKYLIEYDGSQHYNKNSLFDYEYTHNHDIIKTKWCKDNNIPLIRIPYTHYDNLKLEDLLLETSQFVV